MANITYEDYRLAKGNAEALLKSYALPSPTRNQAHEDYVFPTDPSKMHINELGKLMLMLAGFSGYCARLLAIQDSELTVLKNHLDVMLGYAMYEVQKDKASPTRLVKEQLQAIAINENSDVSVLWKLVNQKQIARDQLAAQHSIYNNQFQALSRELARRELEWKMSSNLKIS